MMTQNANAEYHYAECCFYRMSIMLSVIMMNAVILNVIMLDVTAPFLQMFHQQNVSELEKHASLFHFQLRWLFLDFAALLNPGKRSPWKLLFW